MAVDLNQLAADDDAYAAQVSAAAAAKQTQEALQPKDQDQSSFISKFMTGAGRVTTDTLDWAVQASDKIMAARQRVGQDIGAGVATAAANAGDAIGSAFKASGQGMAAAEDPDHASEAMDDGPKWPTSPIWDHAKSTILDFRDAVAVKDPTLADNLLQSGAQLAVPFAGYSRALAGVHGLANIALAGGLTDATMLGPHDPRMADLISLGRHVEGKLGDTLRTLSPDGSALNAYINYLGDRTDESEAEGRFKNVLDGFGVNMIATPLLAAVGSALKQGTAGLRYAIENGVGSAGDLMPAPQEGMIGYHGTTADFDAFDNSKIGSGEGNQTFGHGMYFAENPETATYYSNALERRNVIAGSPMDSALKEVKRSDGSNRDAYQSLVKKAALQHDPGLRQDLLKAADIVKAGNAKPRAQVMHVDIPDEHVSSMVDWDQPVSAQPNFQKALADLNVTVEPKNGRFQVMVNGKPGPQYLSRQAAMSETDLLRGEGQDVNAGMAYNQLAEALRSPKAASEYLSSKGIPGIKYLDQGSRDSGAGTRNLVLFDSKHAKIVAKNGKSVAGQDRPNMNMSPQERALERERVAAQRDREEGVSHDVVPEAIPANAAEREGATARRRKDD